MKHITLFSLVFLLLPNFAFAKVVYWSADRNTYLDPDYNLTIPQDVEMIYDGTGEFIVNKLIVKGKFTCDDTRNLTLRVKDVLVDGVNALISCGNESAPRKHKLDIVFYPRILAPKPTEEFGTFRVENSGAVEFRGVEKSPWTRLRSTAKAGDQTIELINTVNWLPGDEMVLSSSSFNGIAHIEILKVLNNDQSSGYSIIQFQNITNNKNYTGQQPSFYTLLFNHQGGVELEKLESISNLDLNPIYTLENRAEISALSRSIIFSAANTDETALKTCHFSDSLASCQNVFNNFDNSQTITLNKLQGPDIVFGMGSVGKILFQDVEVRGFGKMGQMGKYPFHWHHAGNTNINNIRKSKLINNVVRDSFNRCVTIHQTDGVYLFGNVCFNNFGHAFFLEDGNEIKNHFESNLGLATKVLLRGYGLLSSDIITNASNRFKAPATYWISNPDNIFVNNVAAGSDGTGFWFALKDDDHKPYIGSGSVVMPLAPNKTNLLSFTGNLAHSNHIGFTIDGGPNGDCFDDDISVIGIQENERNKGCTTDKRTGDSNTAQTRYLASAPAIFDKITAYKNRNIGFWNLAQNSITKNSVFADNLNSLALVFSATLKDSALIAQSLKFTPTTEADRLDNNNNNPDNIRFSGFDITKSLFKNKDFSGIELYDGPFLLENVSFVNFNTQMVSDNATTLALPLRMFEAAADRATNNQVKGLRFVNDSSHPAVPGERIKVDFKHEFGHYRKDNWTASLIDLDGSLIGDQSMIGYSINPKESSPSDNLISYDNILNHKCSTLPAFVNALICPSRMAEIVTSFQNRFDLIKTTVSDNTSITRILPTYNLVPNTTVGNVKFPYPVLGEKAYKYGIRMYEDVNTTQPRQFSSRWQATGETSPTIEVFQLMRNCTTSSNAGTEINKASGDTVLLKFKGINQGELKLNQYAYGSNVSINCYVPTRYRLSTPNTIKNGSWYLAGTNIVMNQNQGYIEALVQVNQAGSIVLSASFGPNRGIADVYITKQESLTTPATYQALPNLKIDMYKSAYASQNFILKSGLPSGNYRVKILRSGLKNFNSTGLYLVLDSIWSQ